MSSKKKILMVFKVVIFFFSIHFIFACAGNLANNRGAWVKEQNRISLLEQGPHKGHWKTRDISIEYEYRKETDNFKISGMVELAHYIKGGYNTLEYLYLYVYFLEADGIVLEARTQTLASRRWLITLEKMSFKNSSELPKGTVAIAFGYRGKVSEGGSGTRVRARGERIEWDFWETPRRKPPE